MTLKQTPSQTVGPYFAYGLTATQYGYDGIQIANGTMADDSVPGDPIRIIGQVFDAEDHLVPDAMIELWQADHQGRIPVPDDAGNGGFTGFGRVGTGTDAENRFIFDTIRPGRVDNEHPPHIVVVVFMRGLLTHLYTRLYFPEDADALAADPVLASVPAERRNTLIAERLAGSDGQTAYRFDIRLRGDAETVFFDL